MKQIRRWLPLLGVAMIFAAAALPAQAAPQVLYTGTMDEKVHDLHFDEALGILLVAKETYLLALDVNSGEEQKLRSSLLSQRSYDQAVLWNDHWLRLDNMEGRVSSIETSDYLFKKDHVELGATHRFRWEPGDVYPGRHGFVHADSRGLLTAHDPGLNVVWQTQFPGGIENVQCSTAGAVACGAGTMYLLNCDSGRIRSEISHRGQLEALPRVYDNHVYVLLRHGSDWTLAAYNGQGEKRFSALLPFGRGGSRGTVFVFERRVLAAVPTATDRTALAALDRNSGELLWVREYGLRFLAAASAQTENWILLGGQSSLKAVHPDSGEKHWQRTVYGGPEAVFAFPENPQIAAVLSRSRELQLLRIAD